MNDALAQLLQRLVPGVETRICEEDEMLAFAQGTVDARGGTADGTLPYFRNGYTAFAAFETAVRWRGGDWASCGHWLDFAAGCGRVTRFLAAALGERIAMCDIQDYAVEFQRDVLGVEALLSTTDPDRLELGRSYDWISVVSLFTHLPENTFDRWLARLARALTPGGTLLLTTTAPHAGDTSDFAFEPISESRLDVADYGRTRVAHGRFRESARRAGLEVLALAEKAIGRLQDLWVLAPVGTPVPAAPLAIEAMPRIHVDVYRRAGEGLYEIGGWALDEQGCPLASLSLLDARGRAHEDIAVLQRPDLAAEHGSAALEGGWGARIDGDGGPLAILGASATGTVGFGACDAAR